MSPLQRTGTHLVIIETTVHDNSISDQSVHSPVCVCVCSDMSSQLDGCRLEPPTEGDGGRQ
jgi:hypothetical protein